MDPLLEVDNLKTVFDTENGTARAVDGVSFSLQRRETLGIIGESGCGKTVTALSIMRLVSCPPGRIESGSIGFEGRNLLEVSLAEMRAIRGNKISMIFQEPMTSLNPLFKIGDQISEAIRLHQGLPRKEALEKAVEMLRAVGIPSPEKRVHDFPHQMSGGMLQRVIIAIAISCKPALIIADEPTTALDVTIQSQILDLMQKIKEDLGTAIILITHNMGVISEMADDAMVMYAGRVVESAGVRDLFENPRHPYTADLLKSIPRPDGSEGKKRLHFIPGIVPSLLRLPEGCKFSDRCGQSFERCFKEEPPLFEGTDGHRCRCWLCL